jgi:hypothetical protein
MPLRPGWEPSAEQRSVAHEAVTVVERPAPPIEYMNETGATRPVV